MRKISKDTYELRPFEGGVLHFVIGCLYKANGTCGMTKDKEVIGELKYSLFGDWLLVDEKGRQCSINERTLSYL